MPLPPSQRLQRLKVRLSELTWWRERETVALDAWTFEGEPIAMGAGWPHKDGVVHFAAEARVPADWPIDDTRLILDLGGESLITLTYPDGGTVSFGLDPYHREFPLAAREVSILSDSVARLPFGQPVREPRLTAARLAWIEPAVHKLHLLLRQVAEAVEALGDHEVVPHLLEAAEDTLRTLVWPSDTENYVARTAPEPMQQRIWQLPETKANPDGLDDAARASVEKALAALTSRLAGLAERYPPQGEITLTGHAHIDLAWLWPYDETRRKVRRTFHTARGLMAQSADFVFNQSTAAYYHQLETDDPELLEAIKPLVASGQWETLGGMWVEPDTNMPTGESLVRQVLYGQRYFERVFGVRHTVCWLPDCFGFSPAMPQVLRQGGIENFFTIKVNWSETNKFPYDLFWWEGLDGSKVLAHTFDNPMHGYNGFVQPDCILPTWKNFRGKTQHEESLLAVGYGDGGGGVTPEMVEREVQLRDFPALPKARWGTVHGFFDRAHAGEPEKGYPTWSGEIYLELHRATLTTQSHVKRTHRHAERALITAETVSSMAALMGAEPPQSLETAWHAVLKNEFHDILPGSGIREINADAERELTAAMDTGLEIQQAAVGAIADLLPRGGIDKALVVINPSDTARPVDVALGNGGHIATGTVVPALGVAVIDAADTQPPAGLSVSETRLENATLRATFGADGTISSLVHKPTGREALAERGNQLWVYPADKPRNWDAWDIEDDYAENGMELAGVESMEVVANGPHRAAIRVVKRFRDSTVTQDYALTANGTRLDIETEVDWHDRRAMLRVRHPVAVHTRHATFECAHGVVERATHTNTSWESAQYEVPGHRFADMSEPGFGVALLNNAKYGHSAKGNVLGLSLVRGPVYPDPLADEGVQRFTYSLYPHAGDWHEGGVRQQADFLNQPLLVSEASGLAAHAAPVVALSGIDAALSGLKPAENGNGLVLRVYEPAGRRGAFGVTLPDGWSLGETVNLLEEPMPRTAPADLMPFELRSWRIEKS